MKRLFNIPVLLIVLLFPLIGFGFNLTVTPTHETCQGNASLSFVVTNTIPGSSIVFVVYKLPDITTPFASGTETVVNGLTAGNYRVIARETVGSNTTTQQQDVTITSSFIALNYTVESLNQACSNTSSISVIVNSGTAVSYAIISGPMTFPTQAGNTFSGLTNGIYRIKVTDSCGNSMVQAFTVTLNPTLLTVNNPSFTDTVPPSCNEVVANNTITPAAGTVIGYPLNIDYVLHLPTGITHILVVLNSGNPTSQDISQIVPYPNSVDYLYDVIITDACGTTYPGNSFYVNKPISLSSTIHTLPCNQYYFTLNADNFIGSYTLHFDSAPAGFNPTVFNSTYPGPYTQSNADFGSDSQPVPIGDYQVTITDTCGKTKTIIVKVIDKPPLPNILGISNGCLNNSGRIVLSLADYEIVTAVVTSAPADYPFTLPHDVSALINSDGSILTLDPVPLGDYTIQITDDCGDSISPLTVTVPPFEAPAILSEILQGCDIGMASIKITSSEPVSVKITVAPASYPFPLPHDVSNNIISSGEIYLTSLPTGEYTFSIVNSCGATSNETMQINGYAITNSSFSLVPDCGAFNIPLDFVDNVTGGETFWLQKLLNSTTNTWGNPVTDAVYTDGTVPDETNSLKLQNNATTYNLTINGVFRIVHHFTSYNNGSDINNNLVTSPTKDCIEILAPNLSFNSALIINDVYRIPCSTSGNFDVFLLASGIPPLHYGIVEKDGIPFVVDNGTSDVFLNLTPGIYKFEVEDSCGNSVNRTFDASDLTSLVIIYPTCPIFSCVNTVTGNETFDLSAQNDVILGIQSPSSYTLSYHTSQSDADDNLNPITNLTTFNPTTNPQTIYIRLIFNQFPNCYQTSSFDLITGQIPKINLAPDYVDCDGLPVLLDASTGNLPTTGYMWSNGLSTPTITISDIGTTMLSVTASNNYSSCNALALSCTTSKDIIVNIADVPEIDHIDTNDWTDNENSISVVTTHEGAFEYSLDGVHFQTNPVFSHLIPGLYTVYVRDTGGCRTLTEVVWLLNYPKFFTPNGDGYNETWYVVNSNNEPEFKVYIYDRYGKLITDILSNGPGWDGKLNGKLLFADDYWFVAYRQDGRIHRGHFTLKR
ncbi:T9SS type B sorting domain-containing protein [Flavobacterium sp. AS60]|uniref:T9SS type B sorting domain-containing protein n=1 Tax=Flavobacterium anseongense TaxID=2910677 RepID=UPI001F382B0C|nr:T9SS type B sorting domain-containing protein [Flavobacterium sp. AS60]MCF6129560.1 T9SS type B sorting domain-containing protein [Flavobacterium sp. AS60]